MIIDDDTEQQPEPEPAPEPEPESASESEPEPMPEPVHAATGATTVTAVTKDGVTARPRGRPPTGKEWDYKLGAFVDSGTAKVSKKPLEKPVAANGAKRTNTGLESEEATPPADTKAAEAAAAAMLGPASVFIPEPAVSLPVQPATEERPKGSPFAAADETALMTRADDTAPPPPVSPSAQSELGEMTNTETNTQVEAIAAAQPDLDSPAVAEVGQPLENLMLAITFLHGLTHNRFPRSFFLFFFSTLDLADCQTGRGSGDPTPGVRTRTRAQPGGAKARPRDEARPRCTEPRASSRPQPHNDRPGELLRLAIPAGQPRRGTR